MIFKVEKSFSDNFTEYFTIASFMQNLIDLAT